MRKSKELIEKENLVRNFVQDVRTEKIYFIVKNRGLTPKYILMSFYLYTVCEELCKRQHHKSPNKILGMKIITDINLKPEQFRLIYGFIVK